MLVIAWPLQLTSLQGHVNRQWVEARYVTKAVRACPAAHRVGQIKNPPVVYARQANFANGSQLVNNGALPSGAREKEIPPSKQSGYEHELLPDGRASAAASRVNSTLETVGAINGTTNRRR